jgi:beta-lactam-binding protein with PASTA domain
MNLRSSFWSAVDWLRTLLQNVYFWGGIGALLLVGFGVYLVVDAIVMPTYTRHDVSIRVPRVESQPFEEAKSLMQERNLQVQRQVGRYNPNVDRGIVVDQTPLPDAKVKPGRRVYLTVNAGELPTVKLPDLTGMSVREAKNRLASIGLEVGTVQEDPIPSPYANTITKQDPAPADSLKEGEPVDLWYSTGLGDEEVDVPNVVGYSVADARDFLLRNELRSVVVDTNLTPDGTPSQDVNVDSLEQAIYVREQGNLPGSSVRAGTEIRLFTTTDEEAALEQREELEDSSAAGSN